MCHKFTSAAGTGALVVLAALGAVLPALGQVGNPANSAPPDWRRIGNSAVEMMLASPATGPVDRVWFSSDGSHLFVKTRPGRVFETSDFENWAAAPAVPPASEPAPAVPKGPEQLAAVRSASANPFRWYAIGADVWRSDDGGISWKNLTDYRRISIIGDGMADLAVSPRDADDIVVANRAGLWRSLDGGVSWAGLNDNLPNLPVRRLAGLPEGAGGLRIGADGLGVLEWASGEKQAWRPAADPDPSARENEISRAVGAAVTASAFSGEYAYAGSADGRFWVSADRGRSWRPSPAPAVGPVESIWTDPKDGRLALAALTGRGPRVLRTVNAGLFWDDLTADLPEGSVHGIAADRASGFIYVAADRGVFSTRADLLSAGPSTPWTPLSGLPAAPAFDVRLDAQGNRLYVAVDGYGVFSTLAPHRLLNFRLVNAADLTNRPAAPGSLLSVLGARVQSARAGNLTVPVLAASDAESQIQVPFEARGPSLALALEAGNGTVTLGLPLQTVSPAIFIDREGSPMLLNADTGLVLDAGQPVRAGDRIQILATGLGRVRPDWPTGVPGPLDNPPRVAADVRVFFDRSPIELTRAVLAPGYVGFYVVEVQLPSVLNAGSAELFLAAEGQESNRVRLHVEP